MDERRDFQALLLDDRDVMGVLRQDDVARAFDLQVQLRHVDEIMDRVFGHTNAAAPLLRDAASTGTW
jgi:hypothetical protein